MNSEDKTLAIAARRRSTWRTLGLMLLTVAISVGIAVWVVSAYLFPSAFEPVTLSEGEEQVLQQKLHRLDALQQSAATTGQAGSALEPEPYDDSAMSRDIALSERELNALIATNTNLASQLAIDLSDDLASAKVLMPLDPEMPIVGGKTLRIHTGLEMRMNNGKPSIILKGVSVWGVSLPNAWLGNMKGIDLASEFGRDRGFWQAFAEGVEQIEVKEGKLRIKLKE